VLLKRNEIKDVEEVKEVKDSEKSLDLRALAARRLLYFLYLLTFP
jgi:hypothetical protein